MIKVLFVYTHTVLGGGETMLVRTIASLDRKRINPVAVISDRNDRLHEALTRIGVSVIRIHDANRPLGNKLLKALIQFPNFIFLTMRMSLIVLKEGPDIIHAGLSYSALWSIVPARLFGKKFVWVGQTLSDFFAYPVITRFLMYFSHTTVLTCADFTRLLGQSGMLASGPTEVIYTGLSNDLFRARDEESVFDIGGSHVQRPIVALIARFDESQKGFAHFFEMAQIINEKMPHVHFVIVGAPVNPIEQALKARLDILAQRLHIQDVLFYAGFITPLDGFFPYADVIVIPSVYEAPSAVAMEAGAAGKPVVAFSVGGIPEVIRNDETGYLVPYGDVSGLAEKTIALLQNPVAARAMGEKGRRFVRENFSEEKLGQNYTRLYESLMTRI